MDAHEDQQDGEAGAGGVPVYDRPRAYPIVTTVLDAYLKEPAQAAHKPRFEALWAVAADQAGKPAEALNHLKAAGGRLTSEAADHLDDESTEQFAARVELGAGPGGGAAARGAALRKSGNTAAALAAYMEALVLDGSPRSAPAVRGAIEVLETEEAVARGDWAPFLPSTETFDGWVNFLGNWKLGPGHAIVGTSSARGLYLYSRAHIPYDFEVRGRFEPMTAGGRLEAGIVFGPSNWSDRLWPTVQVSCAQAGACTAFFSKGLGDPAGPVVPLIASTANTFLVHVLKGRLSATIDGQAVVSDVVLEKGWRSETLPLQVGIGARSTGEPLAVRFSDVQIRGMNTP